MPRPLSEGEEDERANRPDGEEVGGAGEGGDEEEEGNGEDGAVARLTRRRGLLFMVSHMSPCPAPHRPT
jgi:hypothetical protein